MILQWRSSHRTQEIQKVISTLASKQELCRVFQKPAHANNVQTSGRVSEADVSLEFYHLLSVRTIPE